MADENKGTAIAEPKVGETPNNFTPPVKPAEVPVKPAETPVNWETRAKELETKYKDVDLDKYSKFKDLDHEKVQEALKTYEVLASDEAKFKKVIEILDAKEEAKAIEAAGGDPTAAEKRIKALEDKINGFETAANKKISDNFMASFETGINEAIESNLKGELKELKALSPSEKKEIRNFLDATFQADLKTQKLSLNDVPRLVGEALKSVKENRVFILAQSIKRDESPEGLSGGANAGRPGTKKPVEAGQRVANVMKDFQNTQASKTVI